MRAVAVHCQFVTRMAKRVIADERAEHLVMARARLMGSREDRINCKKFTRRSNALRRNVRPAGDAPTPGRRVLKRTHDGGADGDNAPAIRFGGANGTRGRSGNEVRFVERQMSIKFSVTG